MKHVVDTNALILNPDIIDEFEDIVIPATVLDELDRIKMESGERGQGARRAVRKIMDNDRIEYDLVTEHEHPDKAIITCADKHGATLITGDHLMYIRAKALGVNAISTFDMTLGKPDYTGVIEINTRDLDDDSLSKVAQIHSEPTENPFNLYVNQYLLVYTGAKHVGSYKWNGSQMEQVSFKTLKTDRLGTIKPRNPHQQLAFDLLQNRQTTVKAIFGRFGTGKDYLMIGNALQLIEKGVFDKLIWVRNNVEVKDSEKIGYLPSDMNNKLLPFAMPLADHVGGVDALKQMIGAADEQPDGKQPIIEIQHLGFIRGRDLKRSIIYVTECEDNTLAHIQLLIGRVGEGSEIWFNGDLKQVDHEKFRLDNGVEALKRLAGHNRYGQVTLYKTERSETAAMADLLDK